MEQCERCGAQAVVHQTTILNGLKQENHLCANCASELGIIKIGPAFIKKKHKRGLQCEQCGLTQLELGNGKLLGCSSCYKTFWNLLKDIIQRSQGGSLQHEGWIPNNASQIINEKREQDRLKRRLSEALNRELYEEAAGIRDELKDLEKKYNKKSD